MATTKFGGPSPYKLPQTYPKEDYFHTDYVNNVTTNHSVKPPKKPVVAAIFGLGRAGSIHLTSIINNPRITLKYVVDDRTERFADLKKFWNFSDDVALLSSKEAQRVYNDKEVNVVFIGSPTWTHHDIVVNSIANNKDVFCEKPIAENIEETRKCYEAAKAKGRVLFSAFNRRFDPSYRVLKNRVRNGEVGHVQILKVTARDSPLPSIDYLKTSGGVFHDCLVHDFDMACWVLGELPCRVQASATALIPEVKAIDDFDTIAFLLTFPSGTVVLGDNSRYSAYGYDQRLEVFGNKDNKMANQWGQKAEELEVSNKIAGLGLNKKPITQSTESDESPDAANPADTSLLMKIIRQGLVESKLDIEIQRKDPNSPLYSVKTFEALHLKPNLLKGVYAMGFNAPSKIQETALPTLLADPPQNMIAQSQSGTGKTAAFVLAMLSRVDSSKNYPQVLCLSPTYELAIQTGEVAAKMAKFCPEIKLKYAVRGEEVPRGTKISDHIIIGTPGKMLDWGVKFGMFDMTKIRVFVLDEADVMIDRQGHQDQCIRIHKCLPSTCQMMFFSATYDAAVMEFAEIIVPNPIIIRLLREEESLDNIKQYYVKCKNPEEKYRAICNIYGVITIGQAIIFCHTRKTASWLSEKMSKDGHSVAVLSGELTVEQRIAVLDRFRAGLEKVLITTNVLSRGIDVEQVTLVVNFDMPMDMDKKADCETYLHRIGRTGRFGKAGIAINLIDSSQTMNICKEIEGHFGKKIQLLDIEDAEEIEKIGA